MHKDEQKYQQSTWWQTCSNSSIRFLLSKVLKSQRLIQQSHSNQECLQDNRLQKHKSIRQKHHEHCSPSFGFLRSQVKKYCESKILRPECPSVEQSVFEKEQYRLDKMYWDRSLLL